jgi:hypothetical protein
MNLVRFASYYLIVISLSGCAGGAPQIKQAPPGGGTSTSIHAFVADRMPTDVEKHARTSLPNSYFGAGGASGSLALGLLLGPIGVIGNSAYVDSENSKNANKLPELISVNLADILKRVAPILMDNQIMASGSYELVPAASINFMSSSSYSLTCMLNAKLPTGDPANPWMARYAVSVEGVFQVANSVDTQKAMGMFGDCLKDAHAMFEAHVGGNIGTFRTRTVTSVKVDNTGTIDQQLLVADSALPEKVIVNDYFGLVRLSSSSVIRVQ